MYAPLMQIFRSRRLDDNRSTNALHGRADLVVCPDNHGLWGENAYLSGPPKQPGLVSQCLVGFGARCEKPFSEARIGHQQHGGGVGARHDPFIAIRLGGREDVLAEAVGVNTRVAIIDRRRAVAGCGCEAWMALTPNPNTESVSAQATNNSQRTSFGAVQDEYRCQSRLSTAGQIGPEQFFRS